MTYHITIFDQFHRGDLEAWDGGTYATAEAAIADAKSMIDYELKHFWAEEAEAGPPTVDGLVSRYRCFAEMPVAFGPGNRVIFDSMGYAAERAARMVAEAEGAPTSAASAPVISRKVRHRSDWSAQDVRGLLIVIILSLLLLFVVAHTGKTKKAAEAAFPNHRLAKLSAWRTGTSGGLSSFRTSCARRRASHGSRTLPS